jgi:hypothetical protein
VRKVLAIERSGDGETQLDPTLLALDVVEDRSARQPDDGELDAGVAEEVELRRGRGSAVDADKRTNAESEPGEGQRAVRDGAAEAPSARVVGDDVARRRADDEDRRRVGSSSPGELHRGVGCILRRHPPPLPLESTVYFYELHEGDDDIFSDLLLVHDEEIEPEVFFDLVQTIRVRLQDTFEEDTLIEAIALELEREHGFTIISDERLTASVHVSTVEDENRLISIDDEIDESAEFRTLYASLDADGGSLN